MSRLPIVLLHILLLIGFATALPAQLPLPAFEPSTFHAMRIAHRGGYAFVPENTLEGVCHNIRERGIQAMEIDLRLTADGYLVLFHDERVGRILETNHDRPMAEMTLAELQALPLRDRRLGELHVTEFGNLVDTLIQLVYHERRKFMLELDFKPHGADAAPAIRQLMQGLEARKELIGDTIYNYFFLSTFYPDVLKELRKYPQPVVTAFSVHHNPVTGVLPARLAYLLSPVFARKYGCAIIEPNHCQVTAAYARRWTRRGYLINAYTANGACEKAHLDKLGICYTTNCPETTCEDDPSDMMGKKRKWCKGCRGQ